METYDEYSAWDLFRKGQIDQRKHLKIIEKMIKDNITDLITHGKIIAGDNVVIPVKSLKQYRFMYARPEEGTTVIPNSGKKQKGDIIAEKPKKGEEGYGAGGDGSGGGEHYEVVVNADKIAEYLFDNMELPRLQKKSPKDAYKEEFKMDSISKKGSINNLQKKRTVYENIKRNASKGDASFKGILENDLRFRSNSIKKIPQDKIIALFVRDRSASMTDHKKEMTRIMSFWFSQFLEYKYSKLVEKRFILFDTEGEEVDEEKFYSLSEGGGTRISTGLQLARDLVDNEYNTNLYNVYVFCFSDGDNFPDDNQDAYNLIEGLVKEVNLFGFCHLKDPNSMYGHFTNSGFVDLLRNLTKEAETMELGDVTKQEEIIEVMRQFFGGDN